ncbi:hypothetical protein FRC0485_02126 [Corynebacterium diphtheriae]|nr:hypothetical protein CIP101280_02004 [Corynebacterium diphtheriae]CAB0530352.1 hypothetical protein CIP101434_02293 [Corynebacterium diphtheriae]CAB0815890.1 hypothetical protein FRC0191_02060 [Corynebacterium diphtheriae]CAB0915891.1 hypothetical protein FRC0430_01932 [Corynebacterium diphtheriae]CAB0967776.1 hypothetical protein FRC0436_01931 [Corynebacterium diphtheriae]
MQPAQHCLAATGKDLAIAASLPQPPPPLSYPTELKMLREQLLYSLDIVIHTGLTPTGSIMKAGAWNA